MKRIARVAALAVTITLISLSAPAGAPSATPTRSTDPATIADLVRQEVQRQLPAAVQAEVKRQIDALIVQAQFERRAIEAQSILQTIRGALELYKIQHDDFYPGMKNLADWKALMKPTDYIGNTDGAATYGPYLNRKPVNPYSRSSTVVPAGTATIKDGWTWDAARGIMRIVVPDEERAAVQTIGRDAEVVKGSAVHITPEQADREARHNSLLSTLLTMRGQLELYKIQHADKYPTWKQMAEWAVFTHATDITGNPGKDFGPYIQSAPVNPANGKSAIAPAGSATADTGWTYNETNGRFRAVLTSDQARELPFDGDYIEIPK
jgi:hypothetical protein